MARIAVRLAVAILCIAACGPARAQYSQIGAPFNSAGHSFYESIGVSWSLQGNGWFARFGGAPGAAPPFGGFDPAAQGQFGGAFRSGDVSGFFRLSAGQGSDTFMGSQSASVTVPNGGFGLISDTLQRPFVLGIVPVVGIEPVSPLEERLSRLHAEGGLQPPTGKEDSAQELSLGGKQRREDASGRGVPDAASTAEQGDVSVAEIRARQSAAAAAQAAEIDALVEKGAHYETAGKLGLARIYYQQALRKAAGQRQSDLEAKVKAIDDLRQAR